MKIEYRIYNCVTALILTLILMSCGTKRIVPITGRTYRIGEGLYSDKQMLQGSNSFYYSQYIPQMGGDSRDEVKTAMVKKVAEKLIRVTTEYMRNNGYADELKYYEWDVHLVPAPGQINATCMAGGKILVFESILPIAQNEAGLAAVLGHEIGHAIAHHSAQSATQESKKKIGQILGALGLTILGDNLGANRETTEELIKNTTDLSNDVMKLFEMKYSRKHEHEADHIGMVLMALAGYDPHEAPKFWERMTKYTGDFTNRLLSTHPSNAKRQRWMEQKWMDEALSYYKHSDTPKAIAQAKKDNTSIPILKTKQSNNPKPIVQTKQDIYEAPTELVQNNKNGESNTYMVKIWKLSVRSAPSISKSQVVGTLSSGQIIKVKNIKNGWATIDFNGKISYVKADFLKPYVR